VSKLFELEIYLTTRHCVAAWCQV